MSKPVFEIERVTHEADSIAFTWNDTGGFYRVFKDEDHVYEGTACEFSDGDLQQSKMYRYTIERLENDSVVDVIVLQTSAFAQVKDQENPLQSLVLTTIVAKTQIALSWEEIADVEQYEIYRNGMLVDTIETNRYIDRDISMDESYTYAIHSVRPLENSKEDLSTGKAVLSQVYGALNPFSSKEEAAVEEYTVIKRVAAPNVLLVPMEERKRISSVDQWKFRYTTFLTEEIIQNPNLLSPNHYFKGDDRGFDVDGESYRSRVDVELDYGLKGSPLTVTKDVGQSVAYNYLKTLRDTETASSEGIEFERSDHGMDEAGFLLNHSVGNPLTTAPEIDYHVHAVLRRDGTFDMTGYHDQAPHHEIYLQRGESAEWIRIYQAESKGLAMMSEVTAWKYWRHSNIQ
jgi:hypothetical protein